MSPTANERYFAVVQGELAKERAHALRKVGDRLDDAAVRCRQLLARLDGGPVADASGDASGDEPGGPSAPPADPVGLLEEYRAARLAFQEAKSWLCLQREAIGLHEHRWVDRIYPDPPRR